MERSIVNGNVSRECGVRGREFLGRASEDSRACISISGPESAIRNSRGFSLLELMIAMFILIILISVALPTYQRSVQHARETVLKENLWQMRRSIDQYSADKGRLPKSLDDLVQEKYLREMPIDPITEKAEWNEVRGEDAAAPDAGEGLQDVKSMAEGEDSEGVSFDKY